MYKKSLTRVISCRYVDRDKPTLGHILLLYIVFPFIIKMNNVPVIL